MSLFLCYTFEEMHWILLGKEHDLRAFYTRTFFVFVKIYAWRDSILASHLLWIITKSLFTYKKMDRGFNASFCMLFHFSRVWQTTAFFNPVNKEVICFEYTKDCSHNDTWESKRQICVSSCSHCHIQFNSLLELIIYVVP